MQFGFKSAPAHFQHVMHTALECEVVEWVDTEEEQPRASEVAKWLSGDGQGESRSGVLGQGTGDDSAGERGGHVSAEGVCVCSVG